MSGYRLEHLAKLKPLLPLDRNCQPSRVDSRGRPGEAEPAGFGNSARRAPQAAGEAGSAAAGPPLTDGQIFLNAMRDSGVVPLPQGNLYVPLPPGPGKFPSQSLLSPAFKAQLTAQPQKRRFRSSLSQVAHEYPECRLKTNRPNWDRLELYRPAWQYQK
ncbi:MAG: hypothetical protein LBW85_13170 [Deltaproteobacteria bacterium]|jgi:hypothetical protein|nr:hypothetical protein [Deltaproteobacteria bacterium]